MTTAVRSITADFAVSQDEKPLPERCYAIQPSDGMLITIVRGEDGFYPMKMAGERVFGEQAIEIMQLMNEALGVDWRTREAMQTGSMFGWDVPGARPEAYAFPDEDPILKLRVERLLKPGQE